MAMSLRGRGALAIWHDLAPEAEGDFIEWHNREHIPERLGVPGFLRGRRYRAVAGEPRWFVLYETESLAVLSSPAYLARVNDPTPWTQRLVSAFRNTARAICAVEATTGVGAGGHIITVRLDVQPEREPDLRRWLTAECLPAVVTEPGIVGAHFVVADHAASTVPTEEKRRRAEPDRVPGWVVLVEGSSRHSLALIERRLSAAGWASRGASAEIGIYQLDVLLAKE
jgi:hypothetical protein